jgi:hypothetical protein
VSIDPEALKEHYASLTDEALLLVERKDRTQTAQRIFDSEIRRRRLDIDEVPGEDEEENGARTTTFFRSATDEPADDPDWLETAFTVTAFSERTSGAVDAAEARDALLAAEIPCQLTEHEIDPSDEPVPLPYREYRVMVPASFSLQATSVLDISIYNGRLEEEWKTQLESLSDEEFETVHIDSVCAGLVDRVERLRKTYKGEAARRSRGATR